MFVFRCFISASWCITRRAAKEMGEIPRRITSVERRERGRGGGEEDPVEKKKPETSVRCVWIYQANIRERKSIDLEKQTRAWP